MNAFFKTIPFTTLGFAQKIEVQRATGVKNNLCDKKTLPLKLHDDTKNCILSVILECNLLR